MRPFIAASAAIATALASLAAAGAAEPCREVADPACRATLEPGCRKATEEMLAVIKATEPTTGESHRRRHTEVLAKVEKAIAEGRAQGVGPCETLSRIQKILVNQ